MMRAGSAGPEVEALQVLLAKHGFYHGAIDGRFGPQTEGAVIICQIFLELPADGIAGPETFEALAGFKPPAVPDAPPMPEHPEWPQYVSHKIVQAAPIAYIVETGGVLHILVKPYGDHRVERFVPTEPAAIARAEIGGYAVIYEEGGYKGVAPAKAFEDGYTRVAGA